MDLILTIICLVVSIIVVNGAYRLLMRITGSDMLIFSLKSKLIAYAVCTALLTTIFGQS